jgi:hypothetical protein
MRLDPLLERPRVHGTIELLGNPVLRLPQSKEAARSWIFDDDVSFAGHLLPTRDQIVAKLRSKDQHVRTS